MYFDTLLTVAVNIDALSPGTFTCVCVRVICACAGHDDCHHFTDNYNHGNDIAYNDHNVHVNGNNHGHDNGYNHAAPTLRV